MNILRQYHELPKDEKKKITRSTFEDVYKQTPKNEQIVIDDFIIETSRQIRSFSETSAKELFLAISLATTEIEYYNSKRTKSNNERHIGGENEQG